MTPVALRDRQTAQSEAPTDPPDPGLARDEVVVAPQAQKTAIQFVDYVLEKLPFHVERNQTAAAPSSRWPPTGTFDRGIEHVRIKPTTPRLNGKVERSHRIDGE